MAAKKQKQLSYPVSSLQAQSLGAEYIHSHWLYFNNTIKRQFNGEDVLTRAAKKLHEGIITIIKKEIDFYKEVEKEYIYDTNSRLPSRLSRSRLRERFWNQYQKELNDPRTPIGKLESLKVQSIGPTKWPKNAYFKMKDNAEIEKDIASGKTVSRGRSREDLVQDLKSGINAVLAIFERANLDKGLAEYSVKNPRQYVQGVDKISIGDPRFKKAVMKKINKLQRIIDSGKTELSEVQLLQEIMEDIGIHSYFGFWSEKLIPGFVNNRLGAYAEEIVKIAGGKKKGGAKRLAEEAKDYNVIDTYLKKVTVKKTKVVTGLNLKYMKRSSYNKTYKVRNDIYEAVETFGKMQVDDVGLKKDAKFFLYIRKNLAALSSWSVDKPRNIIDPDDFIKKEVAISFLINFLRFLNGFSVLLENGDFSPFTSKEGLKRPIIFNVFLVTRQGVYYTLDLWYSLLQTVENFDKLIFNKGSKGDFKFNAPGFSAKAILKQKPNLDSSKLWMAKKKAFKDLKLKKQEITYDNLQSAVFSDMQALGRLAGELLVDQFYYYINPPVIFKNLKK